MVGEEASESRGEEGRGAEWASSSSGEDTDTGGTTVGPLGSVWGEPDTDEVEEVDRTGGGWVGRDSSWRV